jgi:hypothetical protein
MSGSTLARQYQELKTIAKRDLQNTEVSSKLSEITRDAFTFIISKCRKKQLISMVPNKAYFSFNRGTKLSRPINDALFIADERELERHLALFQSGQLATISPDEITRLVYTMAMTFCAATDVQKIGDKKTPGTYFEYLIGHMFARELGLNPQKEIEVLNLDARTSLPTDFVFDLGPDRTKLHLPVKTSTRERVIQVWAHQRIIDGVYGAGRFKGVLVVLTETKLDLKSRQVVEICLPEQWRAYQMFIARLERVYYLDVPHKYAALASVYPNIQVKMLGEFYAEKEQLIA